MVIDWTDCGQFIKGSSVGRTTFVRLLGLWRHSLNSAGAAMVRRSATPGPESTPQRPDRPSDEPTFSWLICKRFAVRMLSCIVVISWRQPMAVRVLLLSILQWHFLLRLMRHALCILRRVFSCVSCILFLPVIKKKNDGCAASAAWRTQSFRRSSIQKSCISMCVQAWNFQFCVWTQKWRERRRGTRRLLAAVCSEDTHENVRAPVPDRLYFFVCAWKKKKGWFWITSSLSFYQISRREQLLCLLFFSFALCCFKINCCLDDFRWYEQAHVVRFSLAMSLTWRMYFVKQSHALCLQFCMHQIMLCAASTCVESRCDFLIR